MTLVPFNFGIAMFTSTLAPAEACIAALADCEGPFNAVCGVVRRGVLVARADVGDANDRRGYQVSTTIEIMLQTKRRMGSGERIKQVICVLTGLDPKAAFPNSTDGGVDSYTKSLTETRSTMLQGSICNLNVAVRVKLRPFSMAAQLERATPTRNEYAVTTKVLFQSVGQRWQHQLRLNRLSCQAVNWVASPTATSDCKRGLPSFHFTIK